MFRSKQRSKSYTWCLSKNIYGRAQVIVNSGRICDQSDTLALQLFESVFGKYFNSGSYHDCLASRQHCFRHR